MQPMHVIFFDSPHAFRDWLQRHHATAAEIWVGFYRKDAGRGGLTYREALDEALCFGWIDGVRKKVDDQSYTNRFSPRRSRSVWSNVNIARVEELIALERMAPPGLAAFEARTPERSGIYSFERRSATFDEALARRFQAKRRAWRFFEAQPPGYRRLATFFVMSAKRPETRQRRLDRLIADSGAGRRIGILEGPAAKPRDDRPRKNR